MRYTKIISLALLCTLLYALFPAISAWSCAPLQWTTPKHWFSGFQRQQSFFMQGCGTLVTRNDLYACQPEKPWTECKSDSDCPNGRLCGDGMFPRLCVNCSTSIRNTNYEYTNVTTNVTSNLLAGKFWDVDKFYNHTGVDLIVIEENWSWSASGNALSHDSIEHKRSTWGDKYDVDSFRTSSGRITQYNATHVMVQSGSLWRNSYDNGDGWVESASAVNYFPSQLPPLPH